MPLLALFELEAWTNDRIGAELGRLHVLPRDGWGAVPSRLGSAVSRDDYSHSQQFACELPAAGSNGVVYRSVRDPEGECVACFRPALVDDVRVGGSYEYVWSGAPQPAVRRM